ARGNCGVCGDGCATRARAARAVPATAAVGDPSRRSPQRVGDLLSLCLELLDLRLLGRELGLELLLRLAVRASRHLRAPLGLARLARVPLGDELLLLGAGERDLELLAAELGLAALGAGLGLGGLARVLRRLDLVELGLDQRLGLARAVGLGALARRGLDRG